MSVTVSSVSNLADLLQLIESNEPEQWAEIKNLIYEQYIRYENMKLQKLDCDFRIGLIPLWK